MLNTHLTSLEVLKIDFIDWWDAQWNWCADDNDLQLWIRDHNFFGERVLGLAPSETHMLFPSLKSLSFSSVQFQGASLEIAHAFCRRTNRGTSGAYVRRQGVGAPLPPVRIYRGFQPSNSSSEERSYFVTRSISAGFTL
jgi:hypothetical protein